MLLLQAFSCLLLLTKNRAVKGYRMLAFRVVFEYLQVQLGHALVLGQHGKAAALPQQRCCSQTCRCLQQLCQVVHMLISIQAAVATAANLEQL